MSLTKKIPQIQVKRKRKTEISNTEKLPDEQSPVKFEKIQEAAATEYYAAPRYAHLTSGDQIYAKDSKGNDYPLKMEDKPVYATVYKTIDGVENMIEVPPTTVDGVERFIHDSDRIVYPMNLTTKRPMFGLTESLDEVYLTDDTITVPHYPIDSTGKVYYARLNNGTEKPLIGSDGNFYYAKNIEGKEVYPRQSNGDEFYLTKEIFNQFPALDENRVPYYASRANGDEFYPSKLIE